MFGHGGGGWDDWVHISRTKISSFDFVRFSLRLFLDAQASTWDTSSSRELEFVAGTTKFANLKEGKGRKEGKDKAEMGIAPLLLRGRDEPGSGCGCCVTA